MSNDQLALFGAGKNGRYALTALRKCNVNVCCFIDNDKEKCGTIISGIPVIGIDEFIRCFKGINILITCAAKNQKVIEAQLLSLGLSEYIIKDARKLWGGHNESVVSYCNKSDMEDVILYHVLHDVKDVFYIDVGSNDPWTYSVTKLFYDRGGHGINIDPLPELMELTKQERLRDINLCIGAGAEQSCKTLYCQGVLNGATSTLVKENLFSNDAQSIDIDIFPLREICLKYIPTGNEIHFLKVDTEGFEKQVLLGCDFSSYRPWIVIIESTIPCTDIPSYQEWENILLAQAYHFAYQVGVNRYYVADEKSYLDERFLSREELLKHYRVYQAELIDV